MEEVKIICTLILSWAASFAVIDSAQYFMRTVPHYPSKCYHGLCDYLINNITITRTNEAGQPIYSFSVWHFVAFIIVAGMTLIVTFNTAYHMTNKIIKHKRMALVDHIFALIVFFGIVKYIAQ